MISHKITVTRGARSTRPVVFTHFAKRVGEGEARWVPQSGGEKEVCAHPAKSRHSASGHGEVGEVGEVGGVGEVEVGEVEVSVLWEADAALAKHPAPSGLAASESWAIDEKTDRFGERFGDRLRQEGPMNHLVREDVRSFLKNCLKGGSGGAWSWEVWRWEQGRNQELAGRGSERLESVGGIWSDEIAGETSQLIGVKWRAGCGGESTRKANRQGCSALAKRAQSSTAGLSSQG
jgi:hypothetical protein